LIKELSSTLDILTRLRMKQVQLSIDDFGTGFAMMHNSRTYRRRNSRSTIVRPGMQVNDGPDHGLETIELGHELGLQVIAEGGNQNS